MKAKHTDGPWKAEMSAEGCEECKGYVILRDNGHYDVIAKIPWLGPWCPHNARLIAAAPDLYRIAKFFEFALPDLMNIPGYEWKEVKQMVESAIAKTVEAK